MIKSDLHINSLSDFIPTLSLQIKSHLEEQLLKLEKQLLKPQGNKKYLRIKIALNKTERTKESEKRKKVIDSEKITLLSWLKNQPFKEKIFWANKEQTLIVAGVGIADAVQGSNLDEFNCLIDKVKSFSVNTDDTQEVRYFGGIRFETKFEEKFFRFVLPCFEFLWEEGELYFVCNIFKSFYNNESLIRNVIKKFDRLVFCNNDHFFDDNDPLCIEKSISPHFFERKDFPEKKSWSDSVAYIDRLIKDNVVQKVVFARKTTFCCSNSIDPIDIIRRLATNQDNLFNFYSQMQQGEAFLAGSPERLYLRQENQIVCDAIAGTRDRGLTQRSDEVLSQELLSSPKDLLEHSYVSKAVKDSLLTLCSNVESGGLIEVLQLANVQHLRNTWSGTLKPSISDWDILKALHPTPAVGGFPKDRALEIIDELEKFDRGWYAAPVGWIGNRQSDFAVGIRSGYFNRGKFSIFAGAGIVQGSDANEEWLEIESKIKPFLNAFH